MSEPGEPVVVATFDQRHEAEMALGLLEDADIPGFVRADDGLMQYPPTQIRGARLLVSPENAAAAREVLAGEEELPGPGPAIAPDRLDEEGGKLFAYGLAAIVVAVILVVVDEVESVLTGSPDGLGLLAWIGIAIGAWGVVALIRSSLGRVY